MDSTPRGAAPYRKYLCRVIAFLVAMLPALPATGQAVYGSIFGTISEAEIVTCGAL